MAEVATIYGKDNLKVLVTITDQQNDPDPLDLSSATVEAAARKASGAAVAATTEIQSPASAGQVLISFPAGSFLGQGGPWTCHLRVTIGSDVQTVAAFTFTVNASIYVSE